MKYLKQLGTRQRTIIATAICSIAIFLFTNPIISRIGDYVLPPSAPVNVTVRVENNRVSVSWNAPNNSDLYGYNISYKVGAISNLAVVTASEYFIDFDETEIGESTYIEIKVSSLDNSGLSSSEIDINEKFKEIKNFGIKKYNIKDNALSNFLYTETFAIVLAVLLALLNLWVLFYKVDLISFFTIAIFPSAVIIPFSIFSLTYALSLNAFITKFVFSLAISFAGGILTYFIILTSNILNGARYKKLPLEQAAKASHFIFSLISVYLAVIYVYALNINIIFKIIAIFSISFYFSFAAVFFVTSAKRVLKALVKGTTISLTLVLSILVLSVWPIQTTYMVLSIAIIYYVLLNIALETRTILSKYIYIEFIILLLLVFITIGATAVWGIMGTLL